MSHLVRMGRYSGTTAFTTLSVSVYFAGKLIWDAGAGVVTDRLGSTRSGNRKYFPYGEEPVTTAQDKTKFATYFRDNTTALDYADQRYYGRTMGRFLTPDPYGGSANPADPQSLNRYSYVQAGPAFVNLEIPGVCTDAALLEAALRVVGTLAQPA